MTLVAEPPPVATETLELRVFGGRLDGARQALAPGARLRIGHDFDNALVLRGRGTAGVAVALQLDDARVALEVLSGAPMLLGCALQPGQTAVLPFYVPLMLGEYAIALGEPDAMRWADVPALLAAPPVPAATQEPAAAGHERGLQAAQGWLQGEGKAAFARLPLFERPGLLILAAIALLVAVLAAPAYDFIEREVNSPTAVAQGLSAAGWRDLQVRRDATTSKLLIQGRVQDDQAVERLKHYVTARYEGVGVRVTTLSGVAQAVNELLQAQGVDAEAKAGRGAITVHSEYLPRDRLVALRTRIRTDLPGAGPIRFVRDLTRGPRDLQYFFASKRFGLASLVDGDPGHIVTQDGQFWFAGAILPTGHRLLAVRHGTITFERDGLTESLRVGASAPTPSPQPTTAGQVTPAITRS